MSCHFKEEIHMAKLFFLKKNAILIRIIKITEIQQLTHFQKEA